MLTPWSVIWLPDQDQIQNHKAQNAQDLDGIAPKVRAQKIAQPTGNLLGSSQMLENIASKVYPVPVTLCVAPPPPKVFFDAGGGGFSGTLGGSWTTVFLFQRGLWNDP